MKNIAVSEVMTKQVVSINPEDTVDKMASYFTESNIHHIPVIDSNQKLVGIVSKTDLDKLSHGKSLFKNKNINEHNDALFRSLRVVEIMTRNVTFMRPGEPIETAYMIFKKNRFRAIPIVDEDQLVGIVCPLDLLDYAFAELVAS